MLLKDKIEKLNKSFFKDFPEDDLKVLKDGIDELVRSDISQRAIDVGEKIPAFTLPNSNGEERDIKSLLQKGPLIISFYRGQWCPYCNLELRAYDEVVENIADLGASLVAVSPQTIKYSESTRRMNDLEYELLSDAGNRIAGSFGLAFRVSRDMQRVYSDHGMLLPKYNGDESWQLPVPGTFVIDSDGIVIGRFMDEDYSRRAEPSEVVDVLRSLRQ